MLWQMKFENCGNRMRLEMERRVSSTVSSASRRRGGLEVESHPMEAQSDERRGWWGCSCGAQGDSVASPSRRDPS